MNSLVVLLSVVALAAAKPSVFLDAGVVTYTAPIIATAPAAVSHQSRVDIKSSPAVVTAAVAPVERAIFEPAVIATPGVIAAPAAVSHQSRIDVQSSPAVVSTYNALPHTYIRARGLIPILKTGIAPAPIVIPSVGPVVPLDTPEELTARNAHFQAKALAAAHSVHKRSAPLYEAPLVSTYSAYGTPWRHPVAVVPVAHIAPYSIHTPLKAYSIHPW